MTIWKTASLPPLESATPLPHARIRAHSLLRELPQQVRQMIDRRRHQPDDRLERRLARHRRVAPARHKHLGAAECLSQGLCIGGVQAAIQRNQIVLLLLPHVFREVRHQGFDGGEEFRRARAEVLELLELFFDLWRVSGCVKRHECRHVCR